MDNGAWQHDFNLFYTRYKNFIESGQEVENNSSESSGITEYTSINLPKSKIYGAEFSAHWDIGKTFQSLQGLSSDLSLAWAKGKNTESNEPITSIEPFSGVWALHYSFNEQWKISSYLHFARGKKEKDINSSDLTARMPILPSAGYGVLNGILSYENKHGLELQFGVFNIFDKNYITWNNARKLSGTAVRQRYSAPGRYLSASMRYQF